jgi:hypothetical protein
MTIVQGQGACPGPRRGLPPSYEVEYLHFRIDA